MKEFQNLIGLTIEDASKIYTNGKIRVTKNNGQNTRITMDSIPTRLNVAVVDGKISEILRFG